MVVIQCSHCGEDVELEDGISGLFDCPYCDNEISFSDNELVAPTLFRRSQLFMSRGMKIGLAIIGIGVITYIGFLIFEDSGWDVTRIQHSKGHMIPIEFHFSVKEWLETL